MRIKEERKALMREAWKYLDFPLDKVRPEEEERACRQHFYEEGKRLGILNELIQIGVLYDIGGYLVI